MAGRIRSIKPELIEDAVTAGISDMAFRLFIACILLADDHGNLRYEPAWLRGQVYWARDVNPDTFADAIVELDALVMAYVVKGQRYGAVRNWKKHQKVDRPGKPRVPLPPEIDATPSRESRETLATDLRSPTSDLDHEGDPPCARVGPPAWVDDAFGSVEMSTGETFDRMIVWATYEPDREDKGKAISFPDFKAFLARYAAKQKAQRIRDQERENKPRLVFSKPEPAPAPYHHFDAKQQQEDDRKRRAEEAILLRPENQTLAREASRKLAAGEFAR